MEQKINQAPYLLFERFKFMVLPHLNYSIDGLPGSRCLFITDDESFIISFEENMGCMDLLEYGESSHLSIVSEFHYKKSICINSERILQQEKASVILLFFIWSYMTAMVISIFSPVK